MLISQGIELVSDFITHENCRQLLQEIELYQSIHAIPTIHRDRPGRSLRYQVIDGERIHESFPEIVEIYRRTGQLVQRMSGLDLTPLTNRAAGVNVNIVQPGGEYRWHYDRNAVTAVLYLNQVAAGETEMYPNHRIHLGQWKHTRAQRLLDALLQNQRLTDRFGCAMAVAPRAGLMLVMQGDRCLHSVRAVEGRDDRVSIVMAFDTPQAHCAVQQDLDPYLYSEQGDGMSDPNYQR
ncbi:2OG-Fe(II) oxygenase [Mycobacterium sp.]|uniref:2OG-Fe(II) oxygenase n=1 Tax=Mycobacterium sp. TaxID=1785 RepID=UPI0031D15A8D